MSKPKPLQITLWSTRNLDGRSSVTHSEEFKTVAESDLIRLVTNHVSQRSLSGGNVTISLVGLGMVFTTDTPEAKSMWASVGRVHQDCVETDPSDLERVVDLLFMRFDNLIARAAWRAA